MTDCRDCRHFTTRGVVSWDGYRESGPEVLVPQCLKAKEANRRGDILVPSYERTCERYFDPK